MQNKPLVSVLMTAYNCEKYIAEAIKSVVAATYQSRELINENKDTIFLLVPYIRKSEPHFANNQRVEYMFFSSH